MNENKMPEWESVEALVEFFDNNDMGAYFDEMPEAHFDVEIQRRSFWVSVDRQLMQRLAALVNKHALSVGWDASWKL